MVQRSRLSTEIELVEEPNYDIAALARALPGCSGIVIEVHLETERELDGSSVIADEQKFYWFKLSYPSQEYRICFEEMPDQDEFVHAAKAAINGAIVKGVDEVLLYTAGELQWRRWMDDSKLMIQRRGQEDVEVTLDTEKFGKARDAMHSLKKIFGGG